MNNKLEMTKSPTTTFKVIFIIVLATLLIYIHDFIPKGSGKIGRSSLRVYSYTVGAELRFLIILFLLWWKSKGEIWRFVLGLPIIMTTYQLIIRVFTQQGTEWNNADTKFYVTLIIAGLLIAFYFYKKRPKENE